jgi:hypothetical protein
MTREPWTEPNLTDKSLTPWKLAEPTQADEIARTALRNCPEFPFKPARQEIFIKKLACYEDYQLVRLAAAAGDEPRKEVYGLYAPGDFHPIDGFGYAFERVNKIAPLIESTDTVVEYVLTRLRFELPQILPYVDAVSQLVQRNVDKRLADSLVRTCGIQAVRESVSVYDGESSGEALVSGPAQLQQALQGRPASPQPVTASEWVLAEIAGDPPEIDVIQKDNGEATEGAVAIESYTVRASALVHTGENQCSFIKASVQVTPGGALPWNSIALESAPVESGDNAPSPPLAVRTLRSRSATLVQEWHLLDGILPNFDDDMPHGLQRKLGSKPNAWRTVLAEKFGVGKSTEVQNVILRVADLSFYKTFCLLEVHERLLESYRRSYALIRWHEDRFDIRPLNGTSPVLHKLHAEDDKPAVEKYADDYLRFFCWAVHGEGGPFYIPEKFRELPLAVAPGPEEMQTLRHVCADGAFPLTDVSAEEAKESGYPDKFGVRKVAIVVYLSGIFRAWFLMELTGMMEMVKDEPLVADLTLETERYGHGDLFVLGSLPSADTRAATEADPPAAHHYLEDTDQSEKPANEQNADTTFEEEIAQRKSVSDREFDTPIVLDDNSFPEEEEEISENN